MIDHVPQPLPGADSREWLKYAGNTRGQPLARGRGFDCATCNDVGWVRVCPACTPRRTGQCSRQLDGSCPACAVVPLYRIARQLDADGKPTAVGQDADHCRGGKCGHCGGRGHFTAFKQEVGKKGVVRCPGCYKPKRGGHAA